MLLLIAAAQAMTLEETWLSYDVVGFDPGAVDAAPRGGELLTAGPTGRLALYNPVEGRVVLLDESGAVTGFIDAVGVRSMAWDAAGRLVLHTAHRRLLSLYSPDGVLLDEAVLPDIVPPGGTVVIAAADVLVADVFGNLHRAARIHDGALLSPDGPTLIEAAGRITWDTAQRELLVDGVAWPLPDAIRASGRLVGEDWLLLDTVVAESPIVATRTAIWRETGESLSLPVSQRRYVPRADTAEDAEGRLLYLDPREEGLYIISVTP
jgi:YD repeat-containing protein